MGFAGGQSITGHPLELVAASGATRVERQPLEGGRHAPLIAVFPALTCAILLSPWAGAETLVPLNGQSQQQTERYRRVPEPAQQRFQQRQWWRALQPGPQPPRYAVSVMRGPMIGWTTM
jgi:hypothetical protein